MLITIFMVVYYLFLVGFCYCVFISIRFEYMPTPLKQDAEDFQKRADAFLVNL